VLRDLRLFVLPWLMLLLSACAGRPAFLPANDFLQQLPRQAYIEQVHFYAQDDYQCGPAALAMLLSQRGFTDTPQSLKERVYIPARKGSLQVELVAAAREHALLVYPLAPNLSAILSELDAGNPVLLMQNLAFNWYPQWHYAVVVGYDLTTEEMILHSGVNKAEREPFSLFMRLWDRADRWAIISLPPDQLPASAEPLRYLQAASDLEQSGQLAAAKRSYATALHAWPDQAAARLGLGNVAWSQNQPKVAVQQFRRLVSDFPELQAGWNNLAVALASIGCLHAARQAKACAGDPPVAAVPLLAEGDPLSCQIPACP
jgi:tetratricopeptide (TPR) repeat protein